MSVTTNRHVMKNKKVSTILFLLVCILTNGLSQQSIESADISPPAVQTNINAKIDGSTPEEIAWKYILGEWGKTKHTTPASKTIYHEKTRNLKSGTIIRFRQKHKGLKVDKNEYCIKLNTQNVVRLAINTTLPVSSDFNVIPTLKAEEAFEKANEHLRIPKKIKLY